MPVTLPSSIGFGVMAATAEGAEEAVCVVGCDSRDFEFGIDVFACRVVGVFDAASEVLRWYVRDTWTRVDCHFSARFTLKRQCPRGVEYETAFRFARFGGEVAEACDGSRWYRD
jgi:hypothetical protein